MIDIYSLSIPKMLLQFLNIRLIARLDFRDPSPRNFDRITERAAVWLPVHQWQPRKLLEERRRHPPSRPGIRK